MRMILHKVVLAGIVFTSLLFVVESVHACSCGPSPTVLEEFSRSENVLIVNVERFDEVGRYVDGSDVYRKYAVFMSVETVFKGRLQKNQTINVTNGDGGECKFRFETEDIGQKFLVYMNDPMKTDEDDGFYSVGLCGRSTNLSTAGPDLTYLNNRAALEGKTRLSGSIQAHGEGIKLPRLGDLKVAVSGEGFSTESKANEDGFFEVWDIPAGTYSLTYEMPRGWKPRGFQVAPSEDRYGWSVSETNTFTATIYPKKHTEVHAYLNIDTAIRGHILSQAGEPMKGACVSADWLTPTSDTFRIPEACANEKGEFEIAELPPGTYRLEVNSRGRLSSSNPFEMFYYPSTKNKEKAEKILVAAGMPTEGIVIKVRDTVPLIKISGIVQLRDGKAIPDREVIFSPLDDERYERVEADTDAQGRFSFELPKGAVGTLSTEVNIFDSEFDNCPAIVSLQRSRTGRGPEPVEIEIAGKQNLTAVRLIIPFACGAK